MNDTIYQFVSTNDLLITLAYNNDTVKITKIENLTKNTLIDLSCFKFDRDQANNYEE